ncbi:hypothetical protein IWX46DRAFT_583886 [Phyllosticta citricarpa]|uniref:Uncharacterized protein n=1 Tax=Phyllosticta citricarpa TaxID=55181 RepID=A0ABR1LMR0_9PEZI
MANPNSTPPTTPTSSLSHLKTALPRLPSTDATVLRHAHTLVTIALQRRHNPNQRHYRTLDPRHNVARIIPILALLDPDNVYKNDADDAVVAASPEGRVLRKHAKSAAEARGKLEGIVRRLYAEGWLDGEMVSQQRLLPPQFDDADAATEIVGGDEEEEEDDIDMDIDDDDDDDRGEQPNQDDGATAWWWRDETAENASAATTPKNHSHSDRGTDTSHPVIAKVNTGPRLLPCCLVIAMACLLAFCCAPSRPSAQSASAPCYGRCGTMASASGRPGQKGGIRILKTSGLGANEKSRWAVVTGEKNRSASAFTIARSQSQYKNGYRATSQVARRWGREYRGTEKLGCVNLIRT